MKKKTLIEGQTFARKCDATGEGCNEGFVFGDGELYFKYEKDALAQAKKDGFKNLKASYEAENHYWSTWEEESDHQYIVKGGKLVEIEPTDPNEEVTSELDALREAESFIAGFEDCDNEEEQKNVDRILKKIRACIEQGEQKEKEKNVCTNLLDSLRTDCNMAISGEWDCSTEEGKEGFTSMIESIDRIQKFISK